MLRGLGVAVFWIAGCGRMAFAPAGDDLCLGSLVHACSTTLAAATAVTVDDDLDIDTDASPLCDQASDRSSTYCVVIASDFLLASTATITAHGSKPLVLLATGAIQLRATIDVSSGHDSAAAGAGANPSVCGPGGKDPTDRAGGGFGGSFGGAGGVGGAFFSTTGGGAPAAAMPGLPDLRGGCPGGAGNTHDGLHGGGGGNGGGAIALVAMEIDLDGHINASGAGGLGGPASGVSAGGGGGGSGGMIVLDAPVILPQPNGALFANGGGGGEGGSPSSEGRPGTESAGPLLLAPGGDEPDDLANGRGGGGAYGAQLDGQPGEAGKSNGGSGGGGGGAGLIHAPGIDPAAVAPPSTDPPE